MANNHFHIETPLLESVPLSNLIGCPVYMKLENCQPTSSFKIRGIGKLIQEVHKEGSQHVVSASGGNAGVAVAYVAKKLGINATIFLPSTSSTAIFERIRADGADAVSHGKNYDESNEEALRDSAQSGKAYIHPFDHPMIWEGNSTIITEIFDQLKGVKPCAFIVAVGGGGLLIGVCEGLKKCGWDDVPIVTMETEGARCFNASIEAKQLITLDEITSIATTLGAKTAAKRAFDIAINREISIISKVVTDKEVVESLMQFADDHRFLVEPSCGATLASLYTGIIANLISSGKIQRDGPIIAIICGGGQVTFELIRKWKNMFEIA